jgi:hypothetical protein
MLTAWWCVLLPACAQASTEIHFLDAFASMPESDARSFATSIHYPAESPKTAPPNASLKWVEPLPDTLFPPDIAAPLFWWDAAEKPAAWKITVLAEDGPVFSVLTRSGHWIPTDGQWDLMQTRAGIDHDAALRVCVAAVGGWDGRTIEGEVSLRIAFSPDPIDAKIFFLRKPVPFAEGQAHPELTQWLLADPARPGEPDLVMDGLPVCGNCHTFAAGGSVLGMDVDIDGDKGNYMLIRDKGRATVARDNLVSWNDRPTPAGAPYSFGLFTALSPSGRYAVSTVGEHSLFVSLDDKAFSQLFYPVTGFIGVYDVDAGRHADLPGASDERCVQTAPTFSPDGRTVAFSRAPVSPALLKAVTSGQVRAESHSASIFELNEKYPFRFDIWTVPFNEGRGGEPAPLRGASGNGKSNYFARYSPDGEWIVFTQSPTGLVLQPFSRLMIVPAAGGKAEPLSCNVEGMNSWHSWSPNGRWLVFSGKSRSPVTELFLTHIDKEGRSSPAIRLFRYSSESMAAMVPEFVPESFANLRSIRFGFHLDGSRQSKSGNIR